MFTSNNSRRDHNAPNTTFTITTATGKRQINAPSRKSSTTKATALTVASKGARGRTRVKEDKGQMISCEEVMQSGVAGVGVLSKPRAVLLMEEELRAALASFFCHSSPTGLRQAPVTLAHGGTVDATTDKPVLTMEKGLKAVEATLRQLVARARPYSRLLALLHHGYCHYLTYLQARLAICLQTQEKDTPSGRRLQGEVTRLCALNHDLQHRLLQADLHITDLKDQVSKVEEALGQERRGAVCVEEDRRAMQTQLMEAKVEAGALRRKVLTLQGDEDPAWDPTLLKIALHRCREELSEKTRLLQDMQRQYREVVPRADYDRHQRRLATLTNAHKQLMYAHDLLKEQHDALLGAHEAAVTERDQLSLENHTLRRAATPRPDWNRVAEYVEGGISRWGEMSHGRTSDQLVDVLISELTGSQLSTSSEFIDCKGVEAGVPAYLRYEGSVRNRRLGKRDLALIIDDIWREKRKLANKDPMDEFVNTYFRDRYHLEEVRAEWCYSLADACQRLAHEEQIGLFWGILCGQVEEQVYHHQVDSIIALYEALKARDPLDKGVVSRAEVEAAIKEVFPLKSAENTKVVMDIAARASTLKDPAVIKYHNLFSQGSGGSRTGLVTEVLQQQRDEQDAYIQEVLDELGYSAMDVSVSELSRAFTMVDPRIEQQELDAYLEWVFNTTKDQLKSVAPVPLPLLAARLQTGHIVRIGARI
ncbi:translin-associated factor X-interacting protein 1 [Procambarus clarkii]|uniref:translin-associated factor X-interacting protein 1 n=1 Tax=Procambarus clarkii TaxID=6728 RepID=UPI003743E60D